MGWLKNVIDSALRRRGLTLARYDTWQVMPENLPDAELYGGPQQASRVFRPWLGGDFAQWLTSEVSANTMLGAQKLYTLAQCVRQTLNVPGDIFEAGAGSGGSGRLMLDVLRASGSRKRLWLLDTFEGYQKIDPVRDGTHLKVNDCRCASFADVQRLFANDTNDVQLIRGLIPGTLEQVKTDAVSFAHIDVNLHEPTAAATEFALARLSRGGAVVFDDYGWPATFGARRAIDEACARHGLVPISLPETTQALLWKP